MQFRIILFSKSAVTQNSEATHTGLNSQVVLKRIPAIPYSKQSPIPSNPLPAIPFQSYCMIPKQLIRNIFYDCGNERLISSSKRKHSIPRYCLL